MAHMSHVQAPMPPSLPQDGAASVPFLGMVPFDCRCCCA